MPSRLELKITESKMSLPGGTTTVNTASSRIPQMPARFPFLHTLHSDLTGMKHPHPTSLMVDLDNSCKGKHVLQKLLEIDLRSCFMLLKILLITSVSCQSAFALAETNPHSAETGPHSTKASPYSTEIKPQLQTVDSLPKVVRQTLALHFGESTQYKNFDELAQSFAVPNKFKKPAGIFVTLSRKGKTRACWGSMYPQYPNLVVGTVYTTESALSKEYRYKKIRANEWQLLKPQVTVVRGVEPIGSMGDQNPLMYGLMVRSGSKSAVILPGEAIDAHYQLVMCKLKAGIPSTQTCQIYRIKADVFK